MKFENLNKDEKVNVFNNIINELECSRESIRESGEGEDSDEMKGIDKLEGYINNMINSL